MTQQRQVYRITPVTSVNDLVDQLNFVLGQLANRLDELQGTRGTPTFYSALDMQMHKITNAATGTATTDAAIVDQLGTTIEHHNLLGLTDDDHSQYPLSVGRAGGQTIKGGTAANELLTLQSTAHATRGYIKAEDSIKIFDSNNELIHGFLKE